MKPTICLICLQPLSDKDRSEHNPNCHKPDICEEKTNEDLQNHSDSLLHHSSRSR